MLAGFLLSLMSFYGFEGYGVLSQIWGYHVIKFLKLTAMCLLFGRASKNGSGVESCLARRASRCSSVSGVALDISISS